MPFILTLVASDSPLTGAHIDTVSRHVAASASPVWLRPDKAVDLLLSTQPDRQTVETLWSVLEPHRIDVFVTQAEHRRKKLLLADMDATIVTSETLDELAGHAGLQDKIASITARAMAGELDFKAALRERVGLLKGLPETALHDTLAKTGLSQGAAAFVGTMAAQGATCVLVSGGFTFFTGAIARKTGFHHHHGNALNLEDGKLTGLVAEPILDKGVKLERLQHYAAQLNIRMDQTLAIGDGANDLPMLEAAGLGIGYRPKPLVRQSIGNCIFYGDLTAALYAQGYTAKDFAV